MLDNSGAKNLLRIRILGSTRRSVYIGDSIIGVVKNAPSNLMNTFLGRFLIWYTVIGSILYGLATALYYIVKSKKYNKERPGWLYIIVVWALFLTLVFSVYKISAGLYYGLRIKLLINLIYKFWMKNYNLYYIA